MNKAIIVDHLSLGDLLKDVSFTLQSGEVVGLISSDSKSSNALLEVLAGYKKPISGFVSVLGFDPYLKSYGFLKQICYLVEKRNILTEGLTPIEILEITKNIYGLSDREFNKNLNELSQYVTNIPLLDRLIYKPKVLLINKPDADIDLLYKYNKNNESSALLCFDKVDPLVGQVRRVIVLDGGSLLYDGSIDDLLVNKFSTKNIKVKLTSHIDQKELNEISPVKKISYPYVYFSAPRSVVSYTAAELIQNFPIENITIEELSVEEIIENIKS